MRLYLSVLIRELLIISMRENCRFLWLEGVFDEKTLSDFPSVSIAANAWQKGFIGGLQELGHEVKIFGFPYERIWPLGRLFIDSCQANLAKGFTGNVVGYLNFPFFTPVNVPCPFGLPFFHSPR